MAADVPVRALRFNRAGEIGWTLFHQMDHQVPLYRALLEAGAEFGIGDFGHRAMDSLRLEKGYPVGELDLSSEITPLDANLEPLVDFGRTGFVGRAALLDQQKTGPLRQLVMLEVDARDSDCRGGEAVLLGDRAVGLTTSGGFGHWVGKSLGLAYLDAGIAGDTADLAVEILGERRKAWILPNGILDPGYRRPRG